MGKRLINIPVIFLLSACAFNSSEIERKKENFSDFFLCFPETDKNFNKLDFEKQIIMRKKISPMCSTAKKLSFFYIFT